MTGQLRKSQDFLPRFCKWPTRFETSNQRRPLTVCIAAICEHDLIIGASDQMLTSGDFEFEPRPSSSGSNIVLKITPINESIVAMMAGHSGLQFEILWKVIRSVVKSEKESSARVSVEQVVQSYVQFYNLFKQRMAESSVLAPLGLDANSFISRQREFSDGFSESIARELMDFRMPAVETIIAGRDGNASHLYKLIGNNVECCDMVGFAAIGYGARHAESQFMLRGYNRLFPQEEAFWLTYVAKRKAEVAPGVGKQTQMFSIGPKDNKIHTVRQVLETGELEKIYDAFEAKQNLAFQEAHGQLRPFLKRLAEEIKKSHGQAPNEQP